MMKPIDGLESMLLKNNAPIANNNFTIINKLVFEINVYFLLKSII